jgi:hypothetical protein
MFKGKLLCHICKRKNSISTNSIPLLNASENTIKKHIHLNLPREKKATPLFKALKEKVISVSLTKDEYQFFKRQLNKKGYSNWEAHKKISEIKEQIRLSHQQFKSNRKELNFKEEFERLINE